MTELRVAVVGLGGIARNAHLPVIAEQRDVSVVAVCDPSPEARARVPGAVGFAEVDELLATVGQALDAVLVLTPEHLHAPIVAEFLRSGIPVFCEKPLSSDLKGARELETLASATGTTLMVGFNRRFAPPYLRAREALAERPASTGVFEKTRPELGYRGSAENLIHMVDLARFFFGECVDVAAHAVYDDPYWEDSLSALLTFESGSTASIVGNRSTGIWTERVALHGNGQTVVVDAPETVTVSRDGDEHVRRQSPAMSGFTSPGRSLGFAAQAEHFFSAVRRGEPVSVNDAASAMRTQELMDRILRAAGLPKEDARPAPEDARPAPENMIVSDHLPSLRQPSVRP